MGALRGLRTVPFPASRSPHRRKNTPATPFTHASRPCHPSDLVPFPLGPSWACLKTCLEPHIQRPIPPQSIELLPTGVSGWRGGASSGLDLRLVRLRRKPVSGLALIRSIRALKFGPLNFRNASVVYEPLSPTTMYGSTHTPEITEKHRARYSALAAHLTLIIHGPCRAHSSRSNAVLSVIKYTSSLCASIPKGDSLRSWPTGYTDPIQFRSHRALTAAPVL